MLSYEIIVRASESRQQFSDLGKDGGQLFCERLYYRHQIRAVRTNSLLLTIGLYKFNLNSQSNTHKWVYFYMKRIIASSLCKRRLVTQFVGVLEFFVYKMNKKKQVNKQKRVQIFENKKKHNHCTRFNSINSLNYSEELTT